ncbi:rab gdp/gtp exchange factor [Anaeramoeba flamelloides]|uniref:Rab gdp/gtp exchange factor n=1 Tax=Anaeramoeba flamelloides TaxID=1746091 RepID=A0AAV7YWH9_9EUKA|nr:rab gdp/gtp exchange factor [Anaeramoeba flamelloides]
MIQNTKLNHQFLQGIFHKPKYKDLKRKLADFELSLVLPIGKYIQGISLTFELIASHLIFINKQKTIFVTSNGVVGKIKQIEKNNLRKSYFICKNVIPATRCIMGILNQGKYKQYLDLTQDQRFKQKQKQKQKKNLNKNKNKKNKKKKKKNKKKNQDQNSTDFDFRCKILNIETRNFDLIQKEIKVYSTKFPLYYKDCPWLDFIREKKKQCQKEKEREKEKEKLMKKHKFKNKNKNNNGTSTRLQHRSKLTKERKNEFMKTFGKLKKDPQNFEFSQQFLMCEQFYGLKIKISKFVQHFISDYSDSEKCGKFVRDFIKEISKQYRQHPIYQEIITMSKFESKIWIYNFFENYILNIIYDKAILLLKKSWKTDKEHDFIQTRNRLRFVELRHLEQDPTSIDPEVISNVMKILPQINLVRSPLEKLQMISACSHEINKMLCKKGVKGADDFIPTFIYILIYSNIPNLILNVEYIKKFRSSEKLSMTENGFYFTTIASGIKYLENIKETSLTIDPLTFHHKINQKNHNHNNYDIKQRIKMEIQNYENSKEKGETNINKNNIDTKKKRRNTVQVKQRKTNKGTSSEINKKNYNLKMKNENDKNPNPNPNNNNNNSQKKITKSQSFILEQFESDEQFDLFGKLDVKNEKKKNIFDNSPINKRKNENIWDSKNSDLNNKQKSQDQVPFQNFNGNNNTPMDFGKFNEIHPNSLKLDQINEMFNMYPNLLYSYFVKLKDLEN